MTVVPDLSKSQDGATLIELIITIIIISVSLIGILTVVNLTTRHSADPIVHYQAIAIAESYLEEIMVLPISLSNDVSINGNRSSFDTIGDYDGLSDVGAKDRMGNAITGLENYNVTIAISDQSVSDSSNSVAMQAIKVTVSRSNVVSISINAYKAAF